MQDIPEHTSLITINLNTYKNNLQKISAFVGPAVGVMAVVKGNAYGHGMLECARTALEAGCAMLGVAHAEDGITLREHGITAPVLVMSSESYGAIPFMIDRSLTISLTSLEMLEELEKTVRSEQTACTVHIKVDTGMGRSGVQPENAILLTEKAWNTPGIAVEGIYTHFPCANEDNDTFSQQQIGVFNGIIDNLTSLNIRPEITHMCNSAGMLKFPEAHYNLVRTGIITYGLLPYQGSDALLSTEPVLSWHTKISFIKEVPAGFPVSYGSSYVTSRPSRLATVPTGYSDGYRLALSNKARGIVNGISVPIAGRVCMNHIIFDVTDAGKVEAGDTVTLIGRQGHERITVEELAEISGTINYEFAAGIAGNLYRAYIKTT
ncbi:Alanine racemase 1 [subsurface metagenome]